MVNDKYTIIEKFWSSRYVYHMLIISYLCSNIGVISLLNIKSKKSWAIVFTLLVVLIILIYIIHDKRKFPKFKKNEYGILFAIDIEDEKQYKTINKKFVGEFNRRLVNRDKNYSIRMLNSFNMKLFNMKYNTQYRINEFIEKYRIDFIVFGSSSFGNNDEKIECILHLNSGIHHKKMLLSNQKVLQLEMSTAFKPLKYIEIIKTNATKEYENYAIQLSLVFQYIVGSAYLLSGDYFSAYQEFTRLKNMLSEYTKNTPMINHIKNLINDRICCSTNYLASNELYSYYKNLDKQHLNNMKMYLDASSTTIPDSYQYKLLIAIYYFLAERNTKEALKHINDCKCLKTDFRWKFSKIFLKLYSEDSVSNFFNAYKLYKSYFDDEKYPVEFIADITEFIEMVLSQEPQKKQLHFLLFLLYHFRDEIILSKENYDKFKTHYSDLFSNENFRNMINKLNLSYVTNNSEEKELQLV